MAAEVIDYEHEVKKLLESMEDAGPLLVEHVLAAGQDYDDLCSALRSSPKRRSSPSWSAPAELYMMLMDTFRLTGASKEKRGIGAGAATEQDGMQVRAGFELLLAQVRRTGRTPALSHRMQAFPLNKNNGKRGCKSLRLIYNGCALWKSFYRALLLRGPRRRVVHRPTFSRFPAIQEEGDGDAGEAIVHGEGADEQTTACRGALCYI